MCVSSNFCCNFYSANMLFLKLFHRRFSIAQSHPFLQHHVPILQRLGVNGMSEDESDCDDLPGAPEIRSRPPRYYVVRPAWRARNLTAWLQTFDSMHILMRRMTGEPSRGAYPRQHIYNYTPVRPTRSTAFVSHLPSNAYDGEWLLSQYNSEIYVCPGITQYDFSHNPEVFS